MKDTIILNCSYKCTGSTLSMIESIRDTRFMGCDIINLPIFTACHDCEKKLCKSGLENCCLTDTKRLSDLYCKLKQYSTIVFATPVYLNLPTPKLLSFLSRLNSFNDVNGRDLFKDTTAYIAVKADVSGTQQTASVLMNALNMLGFNFRGKCILERINEWNTEKIRGGFLSEDIPYMPKVEVSKTSIDTLLNESKLFTGLALCNKVVNVYLGGVYEVVSGDNWHILTSKSSLEIDNYPIKLGRQLRLSGTIDDVCFNWLDTNASISPITILDASNYNMLFKRIQ